MTYRASGGAVVDTTLGRLRTGEVIAGLPVREFRWHKGRRHYSGWYWSSTMARLVAYESRLELARIMLGVTVVDVKAPGRRADPEVRAVMEWTRRVAGLRGWVFEEWYGAPPRLLDNVSFLAGYRRRGLIDQELIPVVLEVAGEPSPVADVERRVSHAHPALVRPVVMHLLWSGDLVTDMGRPLGGDSMIWLRGAAA